MMTTVLDALVNYKAPGDARDGTNIAVVEGGTGSGKTVGYSLPALAVAAATGKRIVMTTATVALQEQLFKRDLPLLAKVAEAANIKLTFTLLKGRQRYVCRSRLDQGLDGDNEAVALGLQAPPSGANVQLYGRLRDAMLNKQWNGERDDWGNAIEDSAWQAIQADRGSCTIRKCPNYNDCSFFRARNSVKDATIVVANHSLVLSTLSSEKSLFNPEETIFVFDEGHHLNEVALDHFSARFQVRSSLKHLATIGKGLPKALGYLSDQTLASEVQEAVGLLRQVRERMLSLHGDLADIEQFQNETVLRFQKGEIPAGLANTGTFMLPRINTAMGTGAKVMRALRDVTSTLEQQQAKRAQSLLMDLGPALLRLQAMGSLWAKWTEKHSVPIAKWIEVASSGDDFILAASAMTSAGELSKHLWEAVAAAAITSATITSCGTFDYFTKSTGLARYPNRRELQTKSPFNYATQGELRIPHMRYDPRRPAEFTVELATKLPQRMAQGRAGQLALFSSKRQMAEVHARLPVEWKSRVLMQGDMPRTKLLDEHARRVKAGGVSVIFGLQSFGEGIDLPGKLCEYVYIDKVPFPAPDGPVEEALAEWLEAQNRSAFDEITVPKAGVKLAQWVGRGIRTINDWACITIFDTRIVTKGYGKALLQGLPPLPLIKEEAARSR